MFWLRAGCMPAPLVVRSRITPHDKVRPDAPGGDSPLFAPADRAASRAMVSTAVHPYPVRLWRLCHHSVDDWLNQFTATRRCQGMRGRFLASPRHCRGS